MSNTMGFWSQHGRIHPGICIYMVILMAITSTLEVTSVPDANETEALCVAETLSCMDPDSQCKYISGNQPLYGASLCSCANTQTLDVDFCYKQQPMWSKNEPFDECKRVVGGPPDITFPSETSVSRSSCGMALETLCPQFGPRAGGTNMFIWGKNLKDGDSTPDVSLTGGFVCKVIYSNSTFIHCLTENAYGTNAVGSYLRLKVDKGGGCTLEERTSFTYHDNPVITSQITPGRSILSGGLNVSITGENFRYVSRLLFQIKVMYNGSTQIFATVCMKEEKTIICPAPSIDLTQLNLPERIRSRRDVGAPRIDMDNDNILNYNRHKRQVMPPGEGLIEYPDLLVFAGLKADGITNLQTIQEWQIYKDPSFVDFPDKFLNYRPAWPDFDSKITIHGENILGGLYASDYTVTIGSLPCEDLDISSGSIICTPLSDTPSTVPGEPSKNGDPAMMVRAGNFVFSPGFVHYDLNVWNNSKVRYGIIGGLAVAIPIIACILILIAVKCYLKRKRTEKDDEKFKESIAMGKNDYLVGDYLHPKANLIQALDPELRAKVQSCNLHSGRIDQTDIKSRGSRSGIYLGWLLDEKGSRMMSVDVKTFKDDNVPFRDLKVFLEEAVKLKGLDHPNVQRLIGLNILDNIPKVITPVSEHGDLKSFLYQQRLKQEGEEVPIMDLPGRTYKEAEDITVERMTGFAKDIASGMEYLSGLGYVHGDLAARNCVLDKDYVVKVSDASLSMDIYELDYWRAGEKLKLLPVKWMAPESLSTGLTSVKSDVWAYGVTLWEIFTLGATPYPDVDNGDMQAHLKAGHRLSKPDEMPVSLYAEVTHCWAKEPVKRPDFKTIGNRLRNPDSANGYANLSYNNLEEMQSVEQINNIASPEAVSHTEHDHSSNDENNSETGVSSTPNIDEDRISRNSSINNANNSDIEEEHIKVEVEPTNMSDANMVF